MMAGSSKDDSRFGEVIQVLESQIHEVRQENVNIKKDNAILSSKMDSVLNLILAQQPKKDATPIVISVDHLPGPVDNASHSLKRKEVSGSDSEADDLAKLNQVDVPIRKKIPAKKPKAAPSVISLASDVASDDAQVRGNPNLSEQAQLLLDVDQPHYEQDVLILQDEDDDLEALNAEEEVERVTVSDSMAELINKSFREVLEDDQAKMLRDEFERPSNCQNLVPPLVNGPIWKQMSKFSRSCDISARETQLTLGVAGAAVAASLTVLQRLKKETDQVEPKRELGNVVKSLGKALKLMGSASQSISLKRRKDIKPCINQDLSPLCAENQPVTDLLYGNNL